MAGGLTKQQRSKLVTFLVAGGAALIGEHLLKPKLKKGFRI